MGDNSEANMWIKKIFGANPVQVQWADWNVGPKRVKELTEYALNALAKAARPLFEAAKNTDAAEWLTNKVKDLMDEVTATVATWADESKGPKNEAGVPLSKTGRGAKARYQAYILSWVDSLTQPLMDELNYRLFSIGKPGHPIPTEGAPPGWEKSWRWLDEGIARAMQHVQSVVPGVVLGKVDVNKLWDDTLNGIDVGTLFPATIEDRLVQAFLGHLLQSYGQTLTPEELNDVVSVYRGPVPREVTNKLREAWQASPGGGKPGIRGPSGSET